MDSTKHTLADFINPPGVDIMERARRAAVFFDDSIKRRHMQYRRVSLSGSDPVIRIIDRYTGAERDMIYLASNDYLNLTRHPRVLAAGVAAVARYGAGAGSVPLLGGTLDLHIELEQKIARFKRCPAALIYTSGFGSNAGTLLSLLKQEDIALLDMFVHASIVDGCRETNVKYFRHNDPAALEKALAAVRGKFRTVLVVVDGVYSMDGDIAPLREIVATAHAHGAYVMVDEAHATGVIGATGRGTPQHGGVEGEVDIVAGTFSKALGGVGGFIAASQELVEYLRFFSRPYMFSTAMTPQTAASLLEAIDIVEDEPELRRRLWENIHYFRAALLGLGFNIGRAETAIFPVIIGDDLKVREMCRELHDLGVYVNPVLYPAVPRKLARIRMSLMAGHERGHLDKALNALETVGGKYGIIGQEKNRQRQPGSERARSRV